MLVFMTFFFSGSLAGLIAGLFFCGAGAGMWGLIWFAVRGDMDVARGISFTP